LEAKDGEEGIAIAKKETPDLIVSDIMMPGIDGYELCRTLKNDIETSHIPIILLTAKAHEDHIVEGLETGADDYMTKPFSSRILLSRIKNLIELRSELQLSLQRQNLEMPSKMKVSSMDAIFLKTFRDLLEKHVSNPDFRIDSLCEKLKMGRSTLFKKIKALTGEKPNQFILSYRLERGRQLLEQNFGSITDIAMEVGFNSAAYFAKCFKEKFGVSPSSYHTSASKES